MKNITPEQIREQALVLATNQHGSKPSESRIHYMMGAQAGLEWAVKQLTPEWISVKDRLPENNEMKQIRMYCKYQGYLTYVGGYDVICKQWDNPFGDKIEGEVTNWCEIPQPPQTEKEVQNG